jgi:hypothetical protein
VTVPVDHHRQLGDVVRDHPVALVRVLGTGLVIRIAYGEPGPPGGPDGTGRGHRGRPPLPWVVETRAYWPDRSWVRPLIDHWASREDMITGIGPVVTEFLQRMRVEHRARSWREAERMAADRNRGYQAGEAWADSAATRRQLRRLEGPFPLDVASPYDLGPREQLYVWIFGRLDGRGAIENFWATAVGDAAAIDSEDFADAFRLGALSRSSPGVARRGRRSRVVPPPGA